MTKKTATDNLRTATLVRVMDLLAKDGEDIRQTKAGTAMFPIIDELGDETFITITIQVPKGARDGDPYDGYAEAENFKVEQLAKSEQKAIKLAEKQKKMARDLKARELKEQKKRERSE